MNGKNVASEQFSGGDTMDEVLGCVCGLVTHASIVLLLVIKLIYLILNTIYFNAFTY